MGGGREVMAAPRHIDSIELGGASAEAGNVPGLTSPQGPASNEVPKEVTPESLLCTIMVWGSTFFDAVCMAFIIGAASIEKWITFDNDGKIGLRWYCYEKTNVYQCHKLPDLTGLHSSGFNCNSQDAGNATLGLVGFGSMWITLGFLMHLAVFFMQPSSCLSRMCTPLGNIKPACACGMSHTGFIALIIAIVYLFGDFWLTAGWGHYVDCFHPDDMSGTFSGAKYSDGVGLAVTSWLFTLISAVMLIVYAFITRVGPAAAAATHVS